MSEAESIDITPRRKGGPPTATPEQAIARFWAKADKAAGADACWAWTAYRDRAGYGTVRHGSQRRKVKAHRLALMLSGLDVPAGACVLHRCDNPGCVNPAHLFIGTQVDNVADMVAKGRSARQRGERNGIAKLRSEQIVEIRRLAATGVSRAEIGRAFGVDHSSVSKIVTRKRWAHVPSPSLPSGGAR